MSLEAKRRIVAVVLAVSALWPAAHFFVVRHWRLNPWNWFGWAMYTQPAERVQAHAYGPDGRSLTSQLGSLTQLQRDSLMNAFRPWSLRHLELGELDDPDEFARAILAVFPWESVRIEVHRFGLEPESASIELRSVRSYEYTREDVGAGR